jgi:Holliday junction resolvasome RuvABC endonuclease subunit
MRCIAGIDFSLSCPAMCVHIGDDWCPENCHFFYLYGVAKWVRCDNKLTSQKFPGFLSHEDRVDWISSWFIDKIKQFNCTDVFIENYSYTSHSSSTHVLAEGCGLLKHKIWKEKLNLHLLPVTGIKKFATGKGNSPKEGMCRAFALEGLWVDKILPCPLGKSPLADLVDAYYIAKMGFSQMKQ